MSSIDTDVSAQKSQLRLLTVDDFGDLKSMMDEVYARSGRAWTKSQFETLVKLFPEGQICIDFNGTVVAIALSVMVDHKAFSEQHTYDEIFGRSYTSVYDPSGDILYEMDAFVHPEFRSLHLQLNRRLHEARKALCERLNLRGIIMVVPIVNYQHYVDAHTPKQYIDAVQRKELYDPVLSVQLNDGFTLRRVFTAYLPEDVGSQGCEALLEWSNYQYAPQGKAKGDSESKTARVGCIQWKTRSYSGIGEFLQHVEHFVEALADYQCDVAVFPDYFSAPLMGSAVHNSDREAIEFLATFTCAIREAIARLAVRYTINIAAGSMPVVEEGALYSVAYLCGRDGTVQAQYKLHPSPHEKSGWGMEGGHNLQTLETDFGRIGILIGYDVEFPELARLLSEQSVQMLLVPFWTDCQNGYIRVRRCAQARAIENECYVAIVGSVGHVSKVDHGDRQYAQTAVFSPSDFAFPFDGVVGETAINTEMTLVVDVDFEKLSTLRSQGAVQNFLDRRSDLYSVEWKGG